MSKFYYFGFGSNLLGKRIKIQNKSAQRVGVGRLENHRLDFADSAVHAKYFSPNWNGSPATIIPSAGSSVYGAVWQIDSADLDELDRQEGVEVGIYKPLSLNVLLVDRQEGIPCRTYQLVDNPPSCLDPGDRHFERQPSKTYLNVILNGAEETGLPQDYIAFLKTFKHNDRKALNEKLLMELNLKDLV